MILKENLYTIIARQRMEGGELFRLRWNSGHFIYKAHFPGHPVTPGVCLLQMVVELCGAARGNACRLQKIKNIKFTHPLSPDEHPEVDVWVELSGQGEVFQVKSWIKEGEILFAKINLLLR